MCNVRAFGVAAPVLFEDAAISLATEHESFDSHCRDKFRKPMSGETSYIQASGNAEKRTDTSYQPKPLSSIQCYYCKEFGHYKRECPKLARKNQIQSGNNGSYTNGLGDSSKAPGAEKINQGN